MGTNRKRVYICICEKIERFKMKMARELFANNFNYYVWYNNNMYIQERRMFSSNISSS